MIAPELIIFDCDGVLVDSESLSMPLLHEMLVEHAFQGTEQDVIHHFSGKTLEGCFHTARHDFKLTLPNDFFEIFEERLFAQCKTQLHPIEGIHQLLDALTIPYCVASSGSREKMALTLEVTKLASYFTDKIFTALEVPHGKPSPDIFLHVANHYGVAPEKCLVIEDSVNGVLAAKAANMSAIAYVETAQFSPHQEAGADFCISSMSSLHEQKALFR